MERTTEQPAGGWNAAEMEERIYAQWLERGYFNTVPGWGKPYCITIPPPNITGSLHLGHALNNSILDALTRRHRMLGENALCLPGTDHAGIATQNVVERELAKSGISRADIGREAFIAKCWEWCETYGDRIVTQFHRLGCSYDWSRARFTLDPSYVAAIHEEFIRWWERGLIYRGARVVNWCVRCSSAISDIEVDSQEKAGSLYHFKYPLANGDGSITIATTRPETMLGDAAVAVNPLDERYRTLVGNMIDLPLAHRQIPIVADSYAKMEFGTGAVKVTPAHDLNDFEAGLRNGLPQLVVIGEDGRMTELAGPEYAGMDRFAARTHVVEMMQALGLVAKIEEYTVQTPVCDRCGTVIEPLLSEQWFARMAPELAAPVIEAVEAGKINFVPARYRKIFLDWMNNIQPWCLSRQLWWGHRIPVWWTEDRARNVAAHSLEDAAAKLGVDAAELHQDEDVLDTWFSSALWPHATLGWPAATPDLAFWYPTSLLSTAQEILYLWVARMAMTGLDFLKDVPFRDVYVHATVLDSKGHRMSKSKGNGVDPLDMIEKYGADALRLFLLRSAGMNQDVRFNEEGLKQCRNFCNKLWNATRFVLTNVEQFEESAGEPLAPGLPVAASLQLEDRWILSRVNAAAAQIGAAMDRYELDSAVKCGWELLWDEYCDWYLELAKPRLRLGGIEAAVTLRVLVTALETILRLQHPFVPFVTERAWQMLAERFRAGGSAPEVIRASREPTILFAECPLPVAALEDAAAEAEMGKLMDVIKGFRNLRAEVGAEPGRRVTACIVPRDRASSIVLTARAESIAALAKLGELTFADVAAPRGAGWIQTTVGCAEISLELGSALDRDREAARIAKERAAAETELEGVSKRLADPAFVARAPAAVVEKERARAAELQRRLNELTLQATAIMIGACK